MTVCGTETACDASYAVGKLDITQPASTYGRRPVWYFYITTRFIQTIAVPHIAPDSINTRYTNVTQFKYSSAKSGNAMAKNQKNTLNLIVDPKLWCRPPFSLRARASIEL
jgi:hypothetical protein